MLPAPRLQAQLARCPCRTFSGKCFRVVHLEELLSAKTPKLLFDLGPKISKGGQRFSPPDAHCGLYVSTEHATAGAEFADGLKPWNKQPPGKHAAFDMDVSLVSVLDLTAATIRRFLKTSKPEVQSPWEGYAALNGGIWPPTWTLGHAAFVSRRFDGILFPSTKNPSGTCLLIFTQRLVAGSSHVTIHKQDSSIWERLP